MTIWIFLVREYLLTRARIVTCLAAASTVPILRCALALANPPRRPSFQLLLATLLRSGQLSALFNRQCSSYALRGVCDSQALSGAGGVGVRSLTSSRNITASGSSGTSPAPRKLPQMLSLVKALEKADLKAARKSILVTYVMDCRASSEILLPYARFNGEKQPTSSGWSRCDERGGM